MLIPTPNVKHSMSALLTATVAWARLPSCAPMEPSSTRTTSSAIGGSTLIALKLLVFIHWTRRMLLKENKLRLLLPQKPSTLMHPQLAYQFHPRQTTTPDRAEGWTKYPSWPCHHLRPYLLINNLNKCLFEVYFLLFNCWPIFVIYWILESTNLHNSLLLDPIPAA